MEYENLAIGFVAKNGKFQCRQVLIELTDDGYYVNMYWGGGLLGCHGITYGTDTYKVSTEHRGYKTREVLPRIWAWIK